MYVLYGVLSALLFAFIPSFLFIPGTFAARVGGGEVILLFGMVCDIQGRSPRRVSTHQESFDLFYASRESQ